MLTRQKQATIVAVMTMMTELMTACKPGGDDASLNGSCGRLLVVTGGIGMGIPNNFVVERI